MANKVIQAVAGSGKTYYGTHTLVNGKRCLYLTYTNGNVRNINLELRKSSNDINNCEVMTFSKFVCEWMIRPFFTLLKPDLNYFNGFTTIEPPQHTKNPHNGYVKKEFKEHYSDINNRLFLSRISELIVEQPKQLRNLMFNRISRFVDLIIVDEYQDLTGKDFDLLKQLMKQTYFNVVLTGDIFQADVSKSSFRKKSKLLEYDSSLDSMESFLERILGSKKIEVSTDELSKSRRISPECAKFVSERLGIQIESQGIVNTGVHLIRNSQDLTKFLSNRLTVLIYNNSIKKSFSNQEYRTWSYVKGETCDDVLVVLTKETNKIIDSKIDSNVSIKTRNMLYVALTRAKGELYIVSSNVWKDTN